MLRENPPLMISPLISHLSTVCDYFHTQKSLTLNSYGTQECLSLTTSHNVIHMRGEEEGREGRRGEEGGEGERRKDRHTTFT